MKSDADWRMQTRLAFLTNMVPPYHKPLLRILSERYAGLRIFVSTPMEANRPWKAEWSGLDVVVQKGLHYRRKWRHPAGFKETGFIHLPLDTVPRLMLYRPNIVISSEMGTRTLLALLYRKLTCRCKLFVWSEVTQTTELGRGSARGVLRRFLTKHVDGFLALGPGGVDYIRSLGVAAARIFQIAYTTDLDPFLHLDAVRSGPPATRLLFIGQLIERKGLVPFLETLVQWAKNHPERLVEFVLAGDGPLAGWLQVMPTPPNLKLSFLGALPYEKLPAIYGEAGIFVFPTLADTWGVVVNEAMASALPVLGSRFSQAVGEMVEDGKTGWTFQPDSKAEMYAALDRALSCAPETLNDMRRQARLRALEITPSHVADLIDGALCSGRCPTAAQRATA